MSKSRVTKPSRIPPWATPKTDELRDSLALLVGKTSVTYRVEQWLNHSKKLEMENAILCDFINREMRMTAADPRVSELEQAIAALSNAPADLPRTGDAEQPKALPIKAQRK